MLRMTTKRSSCWIRWCDAKYQTRLRLVCIDSVDIVVHVYAVPPRPQMHGSLLDQ